MLRPESEVGGRSPRAASRSRRWRSSSLAPRAGRRSRLLPWSGQMRERRLPPQAEAVHAAGSDRREVGYAKIVWKTTEDEADRPSLPPRRRSWTASARWSRRFPTTTEEEKLVTHLRRPDDDRPRFFRDFFRPESAQGADDARLGQIERILGDLPVPEGEGEGGSLPERGRGQERAEHPARDAAATEREQMLRNRERTSG